MPDGPAKNIYIQWPLIMKVLYIGSAQGFGNADRFYLIPQKLINGFVRAGHNVYVFNDRDYARASNIFGSRKFGVGKMNAKALEIVRDFRPDLVVLGHCESLHNDTLEDMRALNPDIKIVYRNVDPLSDAGNAEDIENRAGIVDGIFITTAGDVIRQFEKGRTIVRHMPNPIDPSIETGRAFEGEAPIDVFFAGRFLRHAGFDHREETLRHLVDTLPDARFDIYGGGMNDRLLFGHEYITKVSQAKIGLCLNKTYDYYLYASDRIAQYLGNGLLVAIHKDTGFGDVFAEDEMILFENDDDLAQKVKWYLANDDARREAARKSWEKAHRIYNSQKVAEDVINAVF